MTTAMQSDGPAAGSLRRPVIYSALIHAAVIAAILMAGRAVTRPGPVTGYVQVEALEPAPAEIPDTQVQAPPPPKTDYAPLHVANVPPPSATAEAAPSGANVPVKFGMSPESLAEKPETPDSAAAPAGNTLAVPPDTGRDVAATDALPYAGGGTPTAEPPHFVPLSSVTELPRPIDFVLPEYPASSWRAGREAVVKVEVDIEADGKVIAVRPVKPMKGDTTDPLFIDAAVESVRRARFTPARRGPAPVAVRATLPVRFQLRQ